MAARDTYDLAEEFELIAKSLTELGDRLQLEAPQAIASRLYTALVNAGMSGAIAAGYSDALHSHIKNVNDLMADAQKALGAAAHIAATAPERAIRLSPPNSPLRARRYLELHS
jgi:hypothetical protein